MLFGESLGGAVATWLATRERPAGLILESSFTTLRELAGHVYPWFPARWLLRVDYPTIERLSRVRCPVLVIHSPDDEIVPFEHGERLFAAAPGHKQFVKRQGGHNDAFLAGTEVLLAGIERFITSIQDGGPDRDQERAGPGQRPGSRPGIAMRAGIGKIHEPRRTSCCTRPERCIPRRSRPSLCYDRPRLKQGDLDVQAVYLQSDLP